MTPRSATRIAQLWGTEAAMLGTVMDRARAAGWICYPESCGHDLVMFAPARPGRRGPQEGDVVAVEGKLRDNVAVLRQALPRWREPWHEQRAADGIAFTAARADWHCVVVPSCSREFRELAQAMQIAVHVPAHPTEEAPFRRGAERQHERWCWDPEWPELYRAPPGKRLVPALAVDMPAGEPAPRIVTPWKIAAVRLCLRGGEIRRRDDPALVRSFASSGWIREVRREGRAAVYELVDSPTRPDVVYPEIVAALKRESEAQI